MKVKVTNICSEDVLPALRWLASELEVRMNFAADELNVKVDQIRFNTVSITDDEHASKKFAKANESFSRFKDKGAWQRELSLALIFDPRKAKKGDVLQTWVEQMEDHLLSAPELPGGIDPEPIVTLVRSALRKPS